MFENDDYFFILLEYCQKGTLKDVLSIRKTLTEYEIRYFVINLVKGLLYLHSNNIVHRDIKTANLFLGFKMEVKIGDFGLSFEKSSAFQQKGHICGTPNYMAPEIVLK